MLSIYWELLAFSMIGSTILRITVALVVLLLGVRTYKTARGLKKHTGGQQIPIAVGILEVVTSIFLLVGFWTQSAALLIFAIATVLSFTRRNFAATAIESRLFYTLLAFTSLAILFTGPGLFAVDLPL